MVSILVEGDVESLAMVHSNIQRKVPVILINKTGGIADILAFAYENWETFHASTEISESTTPEKIKYKL